MCQVPKSSRNSAKEGRRSGGRDEVRTVPVVMRASGRKSWGSGGA